MRCTHTARSRSRPIRRAIRSVLIRIASRRLESRHTSDFQLTLQRARRGAFIAAQEEQEHRTAEVRHTMALRLTSKQSLLTSNV